ncbi:CD109 antigen isoform X2 [Osmerus eperlanus]|uniref:CD109 antigen isoform X2 n=1 Tax=Osmerus eperlanus TaxID=29151 RepID=UPI002E14C676
MQMELFQVFGLLGLFVSFSSAQNTTASPRRDPSYLISVPKDLRPGISTTLSVTVLTGAPVRVSAELMNGNNRVASNTTTIQGGSTEVLVLPPIPYSEQSYWKPYKLLVNGYVGNNVVFNDSAYLHFNPKSLSTFIQTDKPNYMPGQVVKIRAVSIHPDGRPYVNRIDIFIKDPKRNMIKQWLSLDSVLGVVSKELQLSENPPLGLWTIVTTVNDVVSEQQFNVAHYVLPKFEVKIDAPSVLYRDNSLWGTVTAKYMYGKPVHGQMNVTYLHTFHGIDVSYDEEQEIDGTAEITFDIISDDWWMYKRSVNMYNYENEEFLTITVNVTESLTGLTYGTTWTVTVVKSKYALAFHGYPKRIKPGLNFTAELKISTYNKESLGKEEGEIVTVTVTQQKHSPWSWNPEMLRPRLDREPDMQAFTPIPDEILVQEMALPLPADGVIPIHILLSQEAATVTIDASFKDGLKMLQLYCSYKSPSRSYLQIQSPHTSPKVGSPLTLLIQSNFGLQEFHYMVISKGQVVSAGRRASASLTLTPDETWAPLACVVVYCIHPDGEVINDALHIPITQVLKNKVSLSWSEARVKPAGGVSLKVSVAEPGSLVGILVVDKATRSSQSNNDITREMVLEEMDEYGMKDMLNSVTTMGDPYSIFTACGLTVLTNARLEEMEDSLRPELREGLNILPEGDWAMEKDPPLRTNFPETWLWLDTNISVSETAELFVTAPDSITSWVATAFVMSPNLGLGIVETPVELTVFQDFFLSLNLPVYIIRGELLFVEVILFNYLKHDLEVMVTVAQSDTFEFVFPDNEDLSTASVQNVLVEGESGLSVLFPIRPLVLGHIPISVKAMSFVASDRILKMVQVKPEGLEQSFSETVFLELTSQEGNFTKDISFTFPADVVEGSERVQLTAVGDILGPSITGLESLIQMPYGCGEQNMIHFAPNIYIIRYLETTNQAEQGTLDKATSYMLNGYERELSYQRDDGSFSAFGDSDSSGSTWLSAFVLRCFLQAQRFIYIDPMVLSGTGFWLGAQQRFDGAFLEPGRVIHTELQGGLDGPVSLTAYVLMAYLEDGDFKNMYASKVSSGLMFLETHLALGVSSNYSLCLVTYALALANSSNADVALDQLWRRAEMRDGVPFWGSPSGGLTDSWQPRTVDIEMAAYTLLSMLRRGKMSEGFPLMKWLSQQRNHLGGYGSTQDTVIALQALSEFAAVAGPQNMDLWIRVTSAPPSTMLANFHIHPGNYLLYQSQEVSELEGQIRLQVTAEGHGFALFQMNVFYNLASQGLSRRKRHAEHEAFDLSVEMFDIDMYNAHLHICTSLEEGQGINQTGMAILEVGLLSGLSLAQEGVDINDIVRRVDTQAGKVVLYLDSVTMEEMCVEIPLVVEHKVVRVQDATVVIYDYYEPRRMTVTTYTSQLRSDMSPCSFCGEDCSQCGGEYLVMSGSVPVSRYRHLVASLTCTLFVLLACGL